MDAGTALTQGGLGLAVAGLLVAVKTLWGAYQASQREMLAIAKQALTVVGKNNDALERATQRQQRPKQ